MKTSYKIIVVLLALAVVAGAGAYWYTFMQPAKDFSKLKPDYTLNAEQLFSDFSGDETAANSKYIGKVVELTGKVVTVNTDSTQVSIVLEDQLFGVSTYLDAGFCAANPEMLRAVRAGQTITIRGQCDGMLNDVVISRAVIIR